MGSQEYSNYDKIIALYNLFGQPKEWEDIFYANDYPIPYKELYLYPVEVSLYKPFHILVECLLLSKNESKDIKVISMSYLDYLYYLAKNGQGFYIGLLKQLLYIVLRIKEEQTSINNEIIESIDFIEYKENKVKIRILNNTYDSTDFDNLKNLICEQNAIELPDPTIHPDLLKAYRDVEEYKRKQSKVKICSFEDQINIIVAKTAYKRGEVLNLTIRSFTRLLERVDKIMHYEIMSLLSPDMDEKSRNNIEHYMVASEYGNLKNKIMKETSDLDSYKENFNK